MEFIKKLLKNKKVTTALWQIANGLIVIAIAALSEMDMVYVPMLIAILNMATKEINKKYL